jgi:ABC-type cobalt transport system substrate-binding protein
MWNWWCCNSAVFFLLLCELGVFSRCENSYVTPVTRVTERSVEFVFFVVSCTQVRDSFKPLLGGPLSIEVESALFSLQSAAGSLYKNQWREIIANLKDTKNDLKSVISITSDR